MWVSRNANSSPQVKASSEASGCAGVFQAHRQSPILGFVQSAPEVRALSSASITRPPRSYGPLRLPSDPPPVRRGGCQPQSRRVSPDDPHHPSNVPCPVPRRIETGACVDCFPAHTAFPVSQAGRHPHLHFRGLLRLHARYGRWIAQPPTAAFVTRLQPSQLPDQTARQLPEQSTTLRVEPSSTGDTRRRGALGNPGLSPTRPKPNTCDLFSGVCPQSQGPRIAPAQGRSPRLRRLSLQMDEAKSCPFRPGRVLRLRIVPATKCNTTVIVFALPHSLGGGKYPPAKPGALGDVPLEA